MRKLRLAYNTVSSLVYQVVTIICGFVLPRMILSSYGSGVNGIVNSITQFLSVIAFMDLGVGSVIQSALYKPLSENNNKEIGEIAAAADRFFRNIALILAGYVLVLTFVFPRIIGDQFPATFSASLVVAMSISFFAQYYFGMFDRMLLLADQKGYIQYNAQTVTLIINTICSAILIKAGASIQIVRLTTSAIYALRPLYLHLYVKKNYSFNRHVPFRKDAIKQKWNGLAQHIASVVLENTDTIVLTTFSTLANVSVYSVYHMVIYGVKTLFTVMTSAFQSYWGEMWAKNELEQLRASFLRIEWLIHMGCVFAFGCTGCLLIPFVRIYTMGVTDADYIQPLFGVLLTLAHGMHCIRIPYHILIKSVGHYKQTQSNYIVVMLMNIVISIATVKLWGLIGVAIGTLVAMVYQTIWMERYDSRHILSRGFTGFVKLIAVDAIIVVISALIITPIVGSPNSYIEWAWKAIVVALLWLAVICAVNVVAYRNNMKMCIAIVKRLAVRKQ